MAILGGSKGFLQNFRYQQSAGQGRCADHRRRHVLHFRKGTGRGSRQIPVEDDYLDYAKEMIEKAKAKGVKLLLPVDTVAAKRVFQRFPVPCVVEGSLAADDGPGYRTEDPEAVRRRCKRCQDRCLERTDGRIFEMPNSRC